MSFHYKIYRSSKGGYYWFKTKNEVIYKCFFTTNENSNDILGLPLISPVYYFAFYQKKKTDNNLFDRKISETIAKVLNKFFLKNPNAIISYICDNTDSKAIKRQLAFEKWFIKHNSEPRKTLIKGEVAKIIYAGAILLANHSESKKIKKYFDRQLKEFLATDKSGQIDIIE